jgi:ABC-type multidrug transport system ATPase subunit
MVGKYSGGMRRRISVALSTMGNPNVILLDEPTTGMDPVSRRHVWTLIQRLKMEKSIIMTTHAMEEAELLSDKLIVLNHGQIKCTGTPLQLKNMLGKGYRVSMIADMKNVSQVKYLMKQIVPSCEFLESSGESGGMVFNLPTDKVKELGAIFSIIDS